MRGAAGLVERIRGGRREAAGVPASSSVEDLEGGSAGGGGGGSGGGAGGAAPGGGKALYEPSPAEKAEHYRVGPLPNPKPPSISPSVRQRSHNPTPFSRFNPKVSLFCVVSAALEWLWGMGGWGRGGPRYPELRFPRLASRTEVGGDRTAGERETFRRFRVCQKAPGFRQSPGFHRREVSRRRRGSISRPDRMPLPLPLPGCPPAGALTKLALSTWTLVSLLLV